MLHCFLNFCGISNSGFDLVKQKHHVQPIPMWFYHFFPIHLANWEMNSSYRGNHKLMWTQHGNGNSQPVQSPCRSYDHWHAFVTTWIFRPDGTTDVPKWLFTVEQPPTLEMMWKSHLGNHQTVVNIRVKWTITNHIINQNHIMWHDRNIHQPISCSNIIPCIKSYNATYHITQQITLCHK